MARGIGVVVCSAVLAVACQSASPTGAACARTSECAEQLVCAGGACRTECADARDCAAGSSCVTFRGAGVCVPPAQPVPCVFNADCGALFCRSGQCVRQCTTDHDCERGTCAGGTCSEPIVTPDVPDAGTSEAGVACVAPEVLCQTDGRCHDLRTDAQACGQCGVACASGGACEAGACVCGGAPCVPANDHCGGALPIAIDATGHGSSAQTLEGAGADLAACGDLDGPDVFFRVHADRRSILGVHSQYGTPDVLSQGCGAPSECGEVCRSNDDHYDVAVVEPGDAYVALRIASTDSPATVRQLSVTLLPIDDLAVTRLGYGGITIGDQPTASAVLSATTLATTCAAGDAHGFYWQNCGAADESITACGTGTTGLVLESVPTGECAVADGTGCATFPAIGASAPMLVVVRATGGTVRLDVMGH